MEEGILYAEADPAQVRRSRLQLDVCRHHGRPDVFQLLVAGQPDDARG